MIAATFAGLFAIGCFFGVLHGVRELLRLRRRTASAEGRIVGLRRSGLLSTVWKPEVRFVDHRSRERQFQSRVGASDTSWTVGSTVEVGYDPDDSGNNEVELQREWLTAIIAVVIALQVSYLIFIGVRFLPQVLRGAGG